MGEWLESLVPWGTEVIVWAQAHTPEWLVSVFVFFTLLGYEAFYLIVLPLIYWCIDRQIGIRLGCLALLSGWLNSVLKYVFAIPRPSDPRIQMLNPRPETSPSFPSAHAQNAVANWGYLAYAFRSPILWIVAIVAIVGIGLSRPVLGVHYPQDVIGGWLIGLLLLVVYIRVAPPIERWAKQQATAVQAALVIVVPVLLMFLHPTDNDGRYPAQDATLFMSALVGLGLGLIMERAWVRFRVDGAWWRRGLRYLAGVLVVALFYLGPRLILPEEMAPSLEAALRFLRYALLGWVASFLCPWLFVKLRLAEREGKAQQA
jgi:membrane-associated phospholipid phosphatase